MQSQERTGYLPSDKFNEAYDLADNARFLYEIARDALDEHLKEHDC